MTSGNLGGGALGAPLCLISCAAGAAADDGPIYEGDRAGTHDSPLTQIDCTTAGQFQKVWCYERGGTGETRTNPLMIWRTLSAFAPQMTVVALDAATGRQTRRFDAGIRSEARTAVCATRSMATTRAGSWAS